MNEEFLVNADHQSALITYPIPKIRGAGYQIVGVRDRENADFSIRQDVH
jgi:hypothetical protein